MRISGLISIQPFVMSLVSLSVLATVGAAPVGSSYMTLDRRAPPKAHAVGDTITISDHVAVLGIQLSPKAHGKSTVSRVAIWDGHENPGYVLKTYHRGNVLTGEVEGLKAVHQLIAADHKSVVMKEVKGRTFSEMEKEADLVPGGRKKLYEEWKPKIAQALAKIAMENHILHDDNNSGNIIIDGQNIQFVDWEHTVKKGMERFTTDVATIMRDLDVVLSSSPRAKPSSSGKKPLSTSASHKKSPSTPASRKKSPSSLASGKKSPSPKGSPTKAGHSKKQ